MTETIEQKLALQNAEFDALTKLCECWRVLQQVAVVDDDYPVMRYKYEKALGDFLTACKANGRREFEQPRDMSHVDQNLAKQLRIAMSDAAAYKPLIDAAHTWFREPTYTQAEALHAACTKVFDAG